MNERSGVGLGPPVACKRAQIWLKYDDHGLDSIKNEVDRKAGKQPTGARPDESQTKTQQRNGKDRTDVLPVLVDMQPRKHGSHDSNRKPLADGSLQR